MRAPLSVRIDDGTTDRHVTQYVRGLQFTKTANGPLGAQMRLNLPRSAFSDLGAADHAWVYSPTGRTLWEGFTESPGGVDGTGGQGFDLFAVGTMVLASDDSRALAYVDRVTDTWEQYKAGASSTSASAAASDDPLDVDDEGLLCQFNPGQLIGTGHIAQIGYPTIAAAGMEVGAIVGRVKSGKIDADYRMEVAYSPPSSEIAGATMTTVAAAFAEWAGGLGDLPAGVTAVALRLKRTGGATNVTDDDTWTFFYDLAVLGRRMDRDGVLQVHDIAAPADAVVLASEVVEDLLGRVLTLCDTTTATVEATTFEFDQLAYPEGATPRQVLDDLTRGESDFYWGIGASSHRGYEFWWRAWPTVARYEISTRDDYEASGGEGDLCNKVTVYWTDVKGNKRSTVVTATSADYPALAALEDEGRTKSAESVTLPDGLGSTANAQRIGEQVLAEKADPPKSARAVVRRRILDKLTGNMVSPYEIEPGYPVRVRETGDLLRLTEMTYDDDAGATTLTLGTPVLTQEQRFARLPRVA